MAHVEIESHSGYALLRLTGDEGLHRLELTTLEEIRQTLETLSNDAEIQVVVITGAPEPSFAVGANIRELQQIRPHQAPRYAALGQQVFAAMRNGRQLFLAAIDGYCLGGGLDFALACDVRYATERSRFAHPGANLGIITGFGGTSRLPFTVGVPGAQKLLLSGDTIPGQEAHRLGLVQNLLPPETLVETVCQLAQRMTTLPPGLIETVKELAYTTAKLAPAQAILFEQRAWQWWEESRP